MDPPVDSTSLDHRRRAKLEDHVGWLEEVRAHQSDGRFAFDHFHGSTILEHIEGHVRHRRHANDLLLDGGDLLLVALLLKVLIVPSRSVISALIDFAKSARKVVPFAPVSQRKWTSLPATFAAI
jgi:hypothetical protein